MPRSLRAVPSEVAHQALVNKTLNASQLREAADGPEVDVDVDELERLAADVATPELVPYEYAYTDLYTDGRGNFYIAIKERFYRRSTAKRLVPP